MSILVLATVLTSQIPEAAVEQTWGHHLRSQHHAGAWRIELGDRRFSGDWIVVDREGRYTRRAGNGRKIYLVSTTSKTHCTIGLDGSRRLVCEGSPADVHLSNDVEVSTSTAAIERHECTAGTCRPGRAGTLSIAVRAIAPTLAQARLAYERVHGETIEAALRATWSGTALRMPYTMKQRTTSIDNWFVQDVIEAEATIELTAAPQARIAVREVRRHAESCTYPKHAATSCMQVLPTCTRM